MCLAGCRPGSSVPANGTITARTPATVAKELVAPRDSSQAHRAIALAAGDYHTCALLDDGSVRCWGLGEDGQLGLGSRTNVGDDETPANVANVDLGEAATQIAAGPYHTCAVLASGKVRCWGAGSADWPAYDLGVVLKLASGRMGTCAVLRDAPVRCWGLYWLVGSAVGAWFEQDPTLPFGWQIDFGGPVVDVSIAYHHLCALMNTGSVRCFGLGGDGALGYGNTEIVGDNESPAMVGDVQIGDTAVALGAGWYRTCAALSQGDVRCWGKLWRREEGRTIEETVGDDELPVSSPTIGIAAKATQVRINGSYKCALLETGVIRCWSMGWRMRMTYGADHPLKDDGGMIPIGDVDLGGKAVQLVTGSFHACALMATGQVRCWGNGEYGVLGYGNENDIGDDEPPHAAGDVPLFEQTGVRSYQRGANAGLFALEPPDDPG
jgi:alpha-tubulin suppressor-like RCC1 family protein